MWLYISCAVVACFIANEIYFRWRYDLHRIPSPPRVPIFGHALLFKQAMKSAPIPTVFRNWREELGNCKIMKVDFFGKTTVYVMDADCARNVILAKAGGLPRSPDITSEWWQVLSGDPEVISSVLLLTTTPYVKAYRRTMARCMTSTAFGYQVSKLYRVWVSMQSVIDKESRNGPIDIEDLLVRTTLDAAGLVFFDYDFGELEKGNKHRKVILEALLCMKKVAMNPLKKFKVKLLPFLREAKDIQSQFRKVIDLWHGIALSIRERKNDGDPDVHLWAAMKEFKDPETDELLSIEMLRSEVGTAIIAGMDTTAHTMGWTLALLASHPHVTDKIVDELKKHDLYGPEAKQIDFGHLGQLSYLTAVLKEVMRLVTVIFAMRRMLGQDMTICGYRLPKGTRITVAGTNMVNSEEDWDDPNSFKPERWLSGEDMSKKFYFPFSYGERDCVGQRYAMLLMQFILSNFIATYSFKLVEGETFETLFNNQVVSVAVESHNGININIQRIK